MKESIQRENIMFVLHNFSMIAEITKQLQTLRLHIWLSGLKNINTCPPGGNEGTGGKQK